MFVYILLEKKAYVLLFSSVSFELRVFIVRTPVEAMIVGEIRVPR